MAFETNVSRKTLKVMSNEMLTRSLADAARREREILADVVAHVHEFMRRRLYLDHGCTSIFAYLTTKLRYSNATAQNRIDAARLLDQVPGLHGDLTRGEINLTQISLMAQGLRQLEKEKPHLKPDSNRKREILSKIKSQDTARSAIMIAKELDLELKPLERTHHQKDESVVLQITLSKSEMEALRRAKNLMSHTLHNASWSDVIVHVTENYLKRVDPARRTSEPKWKTFSIAGESGADVDRSLVDKDNGTECAAAKDMIGDTKPVAAFARSAISKPVVREIFRRQPSCQWHDINGVCGSSYQLQIDHVLSVSKGGSNDVENLQVLCGVHNRLKYRQQG